MGRGSLPLPNRKGYNMEQINLKNSEQTSSENVTDSVTDKNKMPVERVTLGKDEAEKLNYWLNQIKSETSGFLEVSKSDLVNFLIRNHGDQLKAKEIKLIRTHKYDLVKHLNWLTPLLKKAIEDNDQERILALHKELKALEIKSGIKVATKEIEPKIKKTRKLRAKKSETNHSGDNNDLVTIDS